MLNNIHKMEFGLMPEYLDLSRYIDTLTFYYTFLYSCRYLLTIVIQRTVSALSFFFVLKYQILGAVDSFRTVEVYRDTDH